MPRGGRLLSASGPAVPDEVVLVPAMDCHPVGWGTDDGHRVVGSSTAELSTVVDASVRVGLAVVLVAYLTRAEDARDLVLPTLPAGVVLLLAWQGGSEPPTS